MSVALLNIKQYPTFPPTMLSPKLAFGSLYISTSLSGPQCFDQVTSPSCSLCVTVMSPLLPSTKTTVGNLRGELELDEVELSVFLDVELAGLLCARSGRSLVLA